MCFEIILSSPQIIQVQKVVNLIDFFFSKNISSTIGNGANNAFYEGPSSQDGNAKQNGWQSYKYEDTKKKNTQKGCSKRYSCFYSDLTSSSSSASSTSSRSTRGSDSMVGMSRYPSRDGSTSSNCTQVLTTQYDSSSSKSSPRTPQQNHETDYQSAAHSIYINHSRADNHSTNRDSDSELFYTFKI